MQAKRAYKMRVRITRFRRSACAGRPLGRLYRAGGLPAVTYGMRVHGVPDAQLASLRATAAFSIFGTPRGRKRTIEFLQSEDPKKGSHPDIESTSQGRARRAKRRFDIKMAADMHTTKDERG